MTEKCRNLEKYGYTTPDKHARKNIAKKKIACPEKIEDKKKINEMEQKKVGLYFCQ